jgi:PAS domain S-box-containing protein
MKRVLIVDDNEENVYYLTALLSAQGFEVSGARHGAEALASARRNPPALVVSDLLMPVMDGYTLLRHWKSDAQLRSAPFIVYTATYTDPEDEQLAIRMGADAFILKPASPEAFLAKFVEVERKIVGTIPPVAEPEGTEEHRLREYSETLIRKLEHKSLQLEESNRSLQLDVTARQVVESALRESEERFRQLAENIDDVFWLSDLEMRTVYYVSPAFEGIWGRSCESVYASPNSWLEAVHPEDRERVRTSLHNQSAGKWDSIYRVVRPDGSLRWIRARTCPVRNALNEVYRIAGVARDITEYRMLEDQYRHAQKMEAVGRLASGVAHDFNNVLSVILGYANLALRSLDTDMRAHHDVEEILLAAERATGITRQLLAFSRQQVLKPTALELGKVVHGMERMLRSLLGADVTFILREKEPVRKVCADQTQIEQVIMNLAVNARDAMPHGGTLTIEVGTVVLDQAYAARHPQIVPGQYVMLAVTDTGYGMDLATRERIFEPFFTTKALGKGTGLGLSTVFGIATQSNGHIDVYSEVGRGTTFKVYFPVASLLVESMRPVSSPSTAALSGSETILLVEDDDQLRELSCSILRQQGYHVLSAANGREALIESEKFVGAIHLLLSDVVMPSIGGAELFEGLRIRRPEMKVLFVSGYTENSIIEFGVLHVGAPFLEKPITPESLLRKVRAVLLQVDESEEKLSQQGSMRGG